MLVCAGAFVCVRVCVCVRVYALRIVARDKILRYTLLLLIILTPPSLHPHIRSAVKLCRKGALQTKREAFFKQMGFQID